MVLPVKECPAAPAQGALAIECRRSDTAAYESIRKIHCTDTEAHVSLRDACSLSGEGDVIKNLGNCSFDPRPVEAFFHSGKKHRTAILSTNFGGECRLRLQRTFCPWDGNS